MRKFNTEGICNPQKHYMVDITERLAQIKAMIDCGKYFTINRARQYGKTTTITALKHYIADDYDVISLDFQKISSEGFSSEESFVQTFCKLILNRKKAGQIIPTEIDNSLFEMSTRTNNKASLYELFDVLGDWCSTSPKRLVLIIDEVDSATNNQVFLDFLSQLRDNYLGRESDNLPAFWSVILAGVTDVKHLKSKIRDDDQHKVNSPWNIASDFDIDMSLSESGIKAMLDDYEADNHTGMNPAAMARELYAYTNGYPYLVSRLCLIIDEKLVPIEVENKSSAWTPHGLAQAVKKLLQEKNTLFDSLTGKLTNYPELKSALKRILMDGEKLTYNPDQEEIVQLEAYGFIRNLNGSAVISNRLFETRLYNLFLSEDELENNIFSKEGSLDKNIFITDHTLNVRLILERFIVTYTQIFGELQDRFKEKDGRELFLLYLKPIINGTGNYYIEAQTRDQKRTDVIIDYLGKQYIIELKIWHGERYNEKGEQQLIDYLNYFGLDSGYMLSFNFNVNKEVGVKEISVQDKTIVEATV